MCYYLKVQLSTLLNYDEMARNGPLRTSGIYDIIKYEGYKVRGGRRRAGGAPGQEDPPDNQNAGDDQDAGDDQNAGDADAAPPADAEPPAVPDQEEEQGINGRKLIYGDIWADDEADRHKISNYGHLNKLKERFAESRWNYFITDLGLDATRVNRDWPNNSDIELIFHTNPDNFCLLKETAVVTADFNEAAVQAHQAQNYKYEIQDLTLHVTRIEPSTELLRYNDNRMLREPARFLFSEWGCSNFILPANQRFVQTTPLFSGIVPTKTLYVITTIPQVTGDYNSNPAIFSPHRLKRFTQKVRRVKN